MGILGARCGYCFVIYDHSSVCIGYFCNIINFRVWIGRYIIAYNYRHPIFDNFLKYLLTLYGIHGERKCAIVIRFYYVFISLHKEKILIAGIGYKHTFLDRILGILRRRQFFHSTPYRNKKKCDQSEPTQNNDRYRLYDVAVEQLRFYPESQTESLHIRPSPPQVLFYSTPI